MLIVLVDGVNSATIKVDSHWLKNPLEVFLADTRLSLLSLFCLAMRQSRLIIDTPRFWQKIRVGDKRNDATRKINEKSKKSPPLKKQLSPWNGSHTVITENAEHWIWFEVKFLTLCNIRYTIHQKFTSNTHLHAIIRPHSYFWHWVFDVQFARGYSYVEFDVLHFQWFLSMRLECTWKV